ncbi:MAG: hypothetical protein RXO32_09405 [Thermoproteus sp.]
MDPAQIAFDVLPRLDVGPIAIGPGLRLDLGRGRPVGEIQTAKSRKEKSGGEEGAKY